MKKILLMERDFFSPRVGAAGLAAGLRLSAEARNVPDGVECVIISISLGFLR
jgi:hypothetical protein